MSTDITQLTSAETERLQALETIVGEGKDAFIRVGSALGEICDSKLYRESFPTFDEYYRTRWGFTRGRAYQLIQAAATANEMSKYLDKSQMPSESAVRELAKAPPEERKAVVEAAQAAGKVTAKAVRAEVERRKPAAKDPSPAGDSEPEPEPPPSPEPPHTESGYKQIEMEISMLANAFYNWVKKYHAKAIGLVWWKKTLERINAL